MARTHYFPHDQVHFTWDEGNEPVLTVESGDTVVVHTRDVSDNQITPGVDDAPTSTGSTGTACTRSPGRSRSTGAEPGDTLAVEVLDLHTEGWGWTAILPGLGLLADDFPDAYLRVFDISDGAVRAARVGRDPARPVPGHDGRLPGGREGRSP